MSADSTIDNRETRRITGRGVLMALLLALPPFGAALWAGAMTIPGGVFDPWDPAMIDLDVYRRTGEMLLAGQDFYHAEGLPWIYPPFAALWTIPFALVTAKVAEIAWIGLTVALLMAMLHRLGLTGWTLSLTAAAAIWLAEPVRETLGVGQLGVLLVSAAVLDSMPGPRIFRHRLLPEGVLVGLATAVKLTPAAIAATLFFSGRRRPGIVAFLTFVAATALGFAVLPQASLRYWTGLLSGDSGINSGIIFKTNQSVMGVWARLFGELSRGGLLASALVAIVGIAAALLVHRAGEQQLALCLAGLTSLLASPISWSHHYVWIIPLTVVLVLHRELPRALRVFGLFYCIWVLHAPFKQLPGGDGEELNYSVGHALIDSLGVAMGLAFVVWCGVLGWRARSDATALGAVVTRG